MKIEKRPVAHDIPTSSTADIAFLLVVYFLLAMSFAAVRGLDFKLPEESDEALVVDPVASVLVEVRADGGLLVDHRPMPLSGLLPYLEPRLRRNPEKPVIVRPRPAAPYGAAVAVLDELRQAPDRLGLEHEVAIALPTEREVVELWQ